MAKTKDKGKRGSKAEFSIRRVANKEDRKRPSVFFRLKTDESFKAFALFEPDPELKKNPGYYEYYDHYDKQANTYVPCAGDKCPFCAANDNPSTRALTAWYFPDNDAKDQIKLFTMNFSTINDISDEADEEGGLTGRKIRIKRLDDRGGYKVRTETEKPLTKKQIEKLIKDLEEKFPDGLEGVVLSQLKREMERLRALDALDDGDDDDDEPTTSKARKGKAVVEEDDDDDDDDDDDTEEESDDDDDDSDDDDDDEAESDDDDDDDEEAESDDDEEEDVTEIEGAEFEVVKVNEREDKLDLKDDTGKVPMWIGEGVEAPYDEMKKGVTVIVSALKDDEGDWIVTEIAVKEEKKAKSGGKKGGKKSK